MKSKILVSSILTIVLCFSLIVGSTFALFTSEDKFDISIISGKVNIDAAASIVGVYSAKGEAGGDLVDENGATYVHDPRTDDDGDGVYVFANGGTAAISGADLVIDRLTPGDKVVLNVNVDNKSNVAIQYRYKLVVAEGDLLASGMVVTDDDGAYEGVKSYVSAWYKAEANHRDIGAKKLSVELPIAAGNMYQDLTVKYNVVVEAVQFNGVTKNEKDIDQYICNTVDELKDAIAEGGLVILGNDITLTETLLIKKDVVIDLNGYTVDANMSGLYLFQSQSNAAPSMTITSSKDRAAINAGDKTAIVAYGPTEINNVTINANGKTAIHVQKTGSAAIYNSNINGTFNVQGSLTLGNGTVVNVDHLGTSLISGGSIAISIDGAKINVGTFKVNGGAMISLNKSTTLEINDTEVNVGLDTTYPSYFISKADNATIEDCTFNVTDAEGTRYDIEFKPDEAVGAKYAWVQK